MKTQLEIAQDLNALLDRHYYSEAPDLVWAVKSLEEQLSPGERDLLKKTVLQRLLDEPSVVNVILVSCWPLPEAVPILISILRSETAASLLTRQVMMALHQYPEDDAYRAIERFLDSEQEGEALTFLARMDFQRTAGRIQRAFRKEGLRDVCLHLLYDRKKAVGLATLIEELRAWLSPTSDTLRRRISLTLGAKAGAFNPFTEEEIRAIRFALNLP